MPMAKWKVKKTTLKYQKWNAYPDSILPGAEYPYQFIAVISFIGTSTVLVMSETPVGAWFDGWNYLFFPVGGTLYQCSYVGPDWQNPASSYTMFHPNSNGYPSPEVIQENNYDIYWLDSSPYYPGQLFKTKTTTSDQDPGIKTSLIRL